MQVVLTLWQQFLTISQQPGDTYQAQLANSRLTGHSDCKAHNNKASSNSPRRHWHDAFKEAVHISHLLLIQELLILGSQPSAQRSMQGILDGPA